MAVKEREKCCSSNSTKKKETREKTIKIKSLDRLFLLKEKFGKNYERREKRKSQKPIKKLPD